MSTTKCNKIIDLSIYFHVMGELNRPSIRAIPHHRLAVVLKLAS
jgi:hypothetical protein